MCLDLSLCNPWQWLHGCIQILCSGCSNQHRTVGGSQLFDESVSLWERGISWIRHSSVPCLPEPGPLSLLSRVQVIVHSVGLVLANRLASVLLLSRSHLPLELLGLWHPKGIVYWPFLGLDWFAEYDKQTVQSIQRITRREIQTHFYLAFWCW